MSLRDNRGGRTGGVSSYQLANALPSYRAMASATFHRVNGFLLRTHGMPRDCACCVLARARRRRTQDHAQDMARSLRVMPPGLLRAPGGTDVHSITVLLYTRNSACAWAAARVLLQFGILHICGALHKLPTLSSVQRTYHVTVTTGVAPRAAAGAAPRAAAGAATTLCSAADATR
jgi:hypothetical protein